MKLRGVLTLSALGAALLACDLIQRLLIAPMANLLPLRRSALLSNWQRFGVRVVIFLLRHIGGARLGQLPEIPAFPGVLVLMNHQSLVDIPLIIASMRGVYPRILTRKRYKRGVPLVSHMARLYRYPFVDPRVTLRGDLKRLRQEQAASTHPLVVYPEGTRTKTGRIGPFKTLGLATVLAARRWSVYLVVVDGLWQRARLRDFLGDLSEMRVRVECKGPFESPLPGLDPVPFIIEMRSVMIEMLDEMRGTATSALRASPLHRRKDEKPEDRPSPNSPRL